MKRFWALFLSLMLCASTAAAGTLDGVFAPYLDVNSDVRYAMTAQIDSLVPYGQGTVDMLNAALGNLSISASVLTDETQLTLSVAGEPVMQLSERAAGNGTELATDLLPNRTLVSTGSAMDALVPSQETSFDLFAAIEEAQACYQELTDAIVPYAEEKKANYKIQDVASSRWSRVARLTVEQSAELAPLMIRVLSCGMDAEYRRQLADMTFGKAFVVALYQTEEGGEDLAVYMKGNVTLADGKTRKLAYQWAFHTDEGVRRDTYKFELTKSSAAKDSRTITASVRRSAEDDVLLLKGKSSAAIRDAEGVTVTTSWDYNLSGRAQEDVRTVEGEASVAVKTTVGEKSNTQTTTITPDMKLISAQGTGALSGTVGIEQQTGKSVHTQLTLLFDEKAAALLSSAAQSGALFAVVDEPVQMPQSSLTQNVDVPEEPEDYLVGELPIGYTVHNAPEDRTTVNLDTLAAEEREALLDEWTQNLAGRMLVVFAKLPPEDSALIRDNMSDEDYAAFLSLVEGL